MFSVDYRTAAAGENHERGGIGDIITLFLWASSWHIDGVVFV